MPDQSLAREAWKKTDLKGLKKIYGSLCVALLNFLFNYEANLRTLGLTLWFVGCTVAAYAVMTALEFSGHLAFLRAKSLWTSFTTDLRNQVISAVKEVAPQVQNQRPALIEGWKLKRLREFLSDKPKGLVGVVGEDGDPVAYSFSQQLATAFKESGWNAIQGSVGFHFSAGTVFILDHPDEASKYSALIGQALLASGIAFQRYPMKDAAFTTCTIYITAQES